MFMLLNFAIILSLLSPTLSAENWDQILNDDFDTSNWINPNDMGSDLVEKDSGSLKRILKKHSDNLKSETVADNISPEKPKKEIQPGNFHAFRVTLLLLHLLYHYWALQKILAINLCVYKYVSTKPLLSQLVKKLSQADLCHYY